MKHSPTAFALLTGGLAVMTAAIMVASPHEAQFPIPVEELDARRSAIFTDLDADGDGLISIEEFNTHEPKRGHRRGRPDSSAAYAHTYAQQGHRRHFEAGTRTDPAVFDELMFTALDSDADGVLSPQEFSHEAMAEARRTIMKERMFAHFDSNDDGYLSTDEFPPNRVAMLDQNADGEISRDEIRRHQHRPDAD